MEETSGEHLGALWEASGMVLGVIWESFREPGHPGGSRRSWTQKVMPFSARMQKSIKILSLHYAFEGQISKYIELHGKMLSGTRGQSGGAAKAPYPRPSEPLQINLFGEQLQLGLRRGACFSRLLPVVLTTIQVSFVSKAYV